MRIEKDCFGSIEIPEQRLWGAQTQRSLHFFNIGSHKVPKQVVRALTMIKIAAARVNVKNNKLSVAIGNAIENAGQKILASEYDDQFPVSVWQTGSGTQSNMNVNEVIANLANVSMDSSIGAYKPIHPNDHVNMSQSSNDTFPTAMHISIYIDIHEKLLPQLKLLENHLQMKVDLFDSCVKLGRTHLQDATPLTLGQEFSAFLFMIKKAQFRLEKTAEELLAIPQGGTAVGTGLNTIDKFDEMIANEIALITNYSFVASPNKFHGLSSLDDIVNVSAALSTTATNLFKMANDIRLLSSGPRCGLGELILPSNEPGSSIMPGKVNPTQCEALSMVCSQVIGNHTTVSIANTHGHLQLNVFRPVVVYNVLESINLLSDCIRSFSEYCLANIEPNYENITKHLNNSLMLITCLSPILGYSKCTEIVNYAHKNKLTLKEACLELNCLDEKTFDDTVNPLKMITPSNQN